MIDCCRNQGYNSCLNCNGAVAQLGERLNGIQEVAGSIPAGSILRILEIYEKVSTIRQCLRENP